MSGPAHCPSCAGVGVVAVPCDHDDCARAYRGKAHSHDERCEQCDGQGDGFDCWGCSEFSTEPLCEDCRGDAACADDFAHRQAHAAGAP